MLKRGFKTHYDNEKIDLRNPRFRNVEYLILSAYSSTDNIPGFKPISHTMFEDPQREIERKVFDYSISATERADLIYNNRGRSEFRNFLLTNKQALIKTARIDQEVAEKIILSTTLMSLFSALELAQIILIHLEKQGFLLIFNPVDDPNLIKLLQQDVRAATSLLSSRLAAYFSPRTLAQITEQYIDDPIYQKASLHMRATPGEIFSEQNLRDLEIQRIYTRYKQRDKSKFQQNKYEKEESGYQGHGAPRYNQGYQGHQAPGYNQRYQGHQAPGYNQGYQGYQGHQAPGYNQGYQGHGAPRYNQGYQGHGAPRYNQGYQGNQAPGYNQGYQAQGNEEPGHNQGHAQPNKEEQKFKYNQKSRGPEFFNQAKPSGNTSEFVFSDREKIDFNPYDILSINRDATDQDIKKAYYKLARNFHPDKAVTETGDQFKKIGSAYKILSDPAKRAEYDNFLDRNVPKAGHF